MIVKMALIINPEHKKDESKELKSEIRLNLVCENCECNEVVFKECTTITGMGYFCANCGTYRFSGCI
jgi:hypothetical protein